VSGRKRILTALLVAFAIVGAAVVYISRLISHAEELRVQAQAAIDECDFRRARELLEESIGTSFGSPESHFMLARTCRRCRVEDFDAAYRFLEEADRLGWTASEIEFEAVLSDCQMNGPTPETEALFRQRIGEHPSDGPLVYEALTRGFLRAGRITEANLWLDHWIRERPDDWYARLWRGSLYQHSSRPKLAIGDYEAVLRRRPNDVAVQRRLGLMLARSGYDYPRALEYLETARAGGFRDPDLLVASALSKRALGEPEETRKLVEEALAQDPEHFRGLQLLAMLELDAGRNEEALRLVDRMESSRQGVDHGAALERLLQLDPLAFHGYDTHLLGETWHLKATVLRRLGRTEAAADYSNRLAHLQDDAAELKKLLRELPTQPDNHDLWYRLGVLNLRIGFTEDGRHWLRRVLEVRPDHQAAREAMAGLGRSSSGEAKRGEQRGDGTPPE